MSRTRPCFIVFALRIIIIFCLGLTGCLYSQSEINDCLPAAIAAKEIMEKNGVASKLLIVHWQDKNRERGHAYTIFRYGKKWSYDKDFGSIPLTSGMDDPHWEAWESNWKRGHKGNITKVYYLEP